MLTQRLVSGAIVAFKQQLHLGDLVGDLPWAFDVPTGTLSFGDLHWHAQILGTESHQTNTWLWAWANTGSNLPPALIQASLQMKQSWRTAEHPRTDPAATSLSPTISTVMSCP